jgi:hypothetical protein
MEPRIDAERGLQPFFGLARLPQLASNHAGMKKQKSIPCAGAECLLHGITRFLVFSVLVQSPGERVPGINVVSHFKLFVGQGEGLVQLDIVVRVEERQVTIVQDLVDVPQHPDVFHQPVLFFGFSGVAGLIVYVSQFRHKHGHRHDSDGALVELDRFVVTALGSAQLAQPRHGAVVARMNIERRQVSMVSCSNITRLKLILAQFVVEPGEIFRG